jgi:glycosyltransferase involved in cell wall biosynthesis
MKIGIDAKWFFRGPVSTRVVLQNLLPELFFLFPEHEWVIFLDKKDKPLGFPYRSEKIIVEYVWARNNMISNVLLLSGKLKALMPDIMVYQTFPSFKHVVPSISFIHDVLFREFPQFFTWKEKLYFISLPWLIRNRSDRVIATTSYVSRDLLKYKYVKKLTDIDIVPLAVSKFYKPEEQHDRIRIAEIRKKFHLPDSFLLFVGRLNVRKNIENLLKAMLLLKNRNVRLVIVGQEDWKSSDLGEILSNQELRERILLTGYMSEEELVLTYSIARIFCFPSFAEGFGLPPLEAMASGVPVIVSETTALPEVCGDAAIYVNPHLPQNIAMAIDTLLEDDGMYNTYRRKGLEKIKQYSWQHSARALMNSIHNTVNI